VGDDHKRSLLLILARQLAANLATPMFLIDANGMLAFFNEAAEKIIGKPFEQIGEISAIEWAEITQPQDLEGNRLARNETPPGIAYYDRRPAHRIMQATGSNGARYRLQVTAYPLFSHTDEFAGVVAIFWPDHSGNGG
jgi:PAS domain-containing protein